jgi:hypothetical protein
MPTGAVLVYGLTVAVRPSEETLQIILKGIPPLQGLVGAGLFF